MSKIDKTLVLIDADSLCFQSSKETLKESIFTLNEKIQNIYEKTQCTHAAFFISKGKYFRHNIDPLYKSIRSKYTSPLKYLKTLKSYLEEEYQANWMEGVEADDLMAYFYNNKIFISNGYGISVNNIYSDKRDSYEFEKIICSPDKDLLNSIKGKHFNYTYKLEDKSNSENIIKGWWVETKSKLEADYFIWKQMLMGDSADGIPCLSKVGEKTAEKLLSDYENYDLGVFNKYLDFYGTSKGIYEFQKNYRLLHLLSTDLDFEREIGKLPQLPKIIELNKTTTINNNNEIDELFK